jgi:hypothetical protein
MKTRSNVDNLTKELAWTSLAEYAEAISHGARLCAARETGNGDMLTQQELEFFAQLGEHIAAIGKILGINPPEPKGIQ